MEKLTAYLERHGESHAAFAERVGCSRAFVTMMAAGDRAPGRKLARRIEIQTAGAVPVAAWDEREDAR